MLEIYWLVDGGRILDHQEHAGNEDRSQNTAAEDCVLPRQVQVLILESTGARPKSPIVRAERFTVAHLPLAVMLDWAARMSETDG